MVFMTFVDVFFISVIVLAIFTLLYVLQEK